MATISSSSAASRHFPVASLDPWATFPGKMAKMFMAEYGRKPTAHELRELYTNHEAFRTDKHILRWLNPPRGVVNLRELISDADQWPIMDREDIEELPDNYKLGR
jgi:hypothetical protein